MSSDQKLSIDITKVTKSKINEVDFSNLTFGSVFTDHMLVCDFKDGAWQKPEIVPYAPFLMDPSSKVFHYGQAIFEGMKAFKDENDDVWLFRPDENCRRFNKSAERLAMAQIDEDIFLDGLHQLIDIERNWIQ